MIWSCWACAFARAETVFCSFASGESTWAADELADLPMMLLAFANRLDALLNVAQRCLHFDSPGSRWAGLFKRAQTVITQQATRNKGDLLDMACRAIEAANANNDFDGLNKGVEMVSKQFSRELKNNNVEIIDAKNRKFDPKTDEVFLTEETNDPEMDNMIVQELEPGYIFKDKLIKAAKVKVAHLKT